MKIKKLVKKAVSLFAVLALALASQSMYAVYAENDSQYPYPDITIDSSDAGTNVYMANTLICELKQNRYLRFRDRDTSDNWVGCERKGADLCIAFADTGIKGINVTDVDYQNNPQNGFFEIDVTGTKPQDIDCTVTYTIKGIWMPDVGKFRYTYETAMDSELEGWYENSKTAAGYYNQNPKSRPPIEITDYHIEQIAHTDRIQSPSYPNAPLRYEWFLSSLDGNTWEKFPKVHVPYPTRRGNYITIRKTGERMTEGGKFGFTDSRHGGWMSEITSTTAGINFELCWYFFDVHIVMYNAVPPRGTQDRFQISFSIDFDPIDADYGNDLVDNATERDWRSLDEYQLPLFTRNNTFDELITEIPSEETAEHYVWWASSFDCYRDDTVGYDDNYSVTIKRDGNPVMPAAWNTYTWGVPFEETNIRRHRFRLSAMVKTENCTGKVRLCYAYQKGSGDLFYGTGTHLDDGTPRSDVAEWQFSESLTGTNDWTPLSMEFTVNNPINNIILEQTGGGQCWFDNVVITDLGEVSADNYYAYDDFGASEDFGGDSATDWTINGYGSMSARDGQLVISTDGQTLAGNARATRNVFGFGGRWVADVDMTVNVRRGTLLACENIFNIEVSGTSLLSKTGDSSYNRVDTIFDSSYQQGTPINLKLIMDFDTKEFKLFYNGVEQDLGNGKYIRSGSVTALKPFLTIINSGYSGEMSIDKFMLYPDTNQGAVNITRADLELDQATAHKTDITLPQVGIDGAAISWSSSAPGVIDGNGRITRGNETRTAVLTANITKNSASTQKQFNMRLAPYAGVTFVPSRIALSEDTASASVTVANDSANEYDNAMLVMACYGGGKLISADAEFIPLLQTAETYELETEAEAVDKISFFLWDNDSGRLTPIADRIDYSNTAKPNLELSADTAEVGTPISFTAYSELGGRRVEIADGDYTVSSEGAEVDYEQKTITFATAGIKDILVATADGFSSVKVCINNSADKAYVKGAKVYQSDFNTQTAADYTSTAGAFTIENVNGTNVLATKTTSSTYDSLLFGPQLSDYMVELDYNMVKPLAAGADAIGVAMRVASNNNHTSYRTAFMERSRFGGDTVLYNRIAIGRAKGSNIANTWHYASYTDSPLTIARDTYYKFTSAICGGKITASLYDTSNTLISSQSCTTAECDHESDGTASTPLTSGKTVLYYHGVEAHIKNIAIYEFNQADAIRIDLSDATPNQGDVIALSVAAITGDSETAIANSDITYTASSGITIDGGSATVLGSGEQYITAAYTDAAGNTKNAIVKFNVE